MKRFLKTLGAVALALVVAATSIPVSATQRDRKSWMSEIEDDTYLSSITIPGTHDSASHHLLLGYCLRCQNTSMAEQLDNGYRYLDIRLDMNDEGDDFNFIHAFATCKTGIWPWSKPVTLSDTLDDIYAFLEANPTETVIFNVKIEDSEDDVAADEQLLLDMIAKNSDKFYTRNAIPTLGEVRGKIVLCTRFEDVLGAGDDATGLHFYWDDQNQTQAVEDTAEVSMINDSQALYVQDHYKYSVEDKVAAFKETIEDCQASDDAFSINFLSLSGNKKLPHPKAYAKTINAELLDMDLASETSYGVIVVDFANAEIAEHIYSSNFNE